MYSIFPETMSLRSYLVRAVPLVDRLDHTVCKLLHERLDSTQTRLKLLAMRAVSQSNINATKLRGFLIPLPPHREQVQICDILVQIDEKIAKEQTRHQALTALFNALLHDLMTGKVRVV